MTTLAGLNTAGIVFVAKPASSAVNGELYVDISSAQLSVKGSGDSTTPIGAAPSDASQFQKIMQNLDIVTIPANALVAKLPGGGICLASSSAMGKMTVIGEAIADIAVNATGAVELLGPNWAGVLTGLGFTPGQSVWMSETSGAYTNDITTLGSSDRVVRVGIADCTAGDASSTVTDLLAILTEEVATGI